MVVQLPSTRESNFFHLDPSSYWLVHEWMLHHLCVGLCIPFTQLHKHTMQQTHPHKAVTRCIEAKILLKGNWTAITISRVVPVAVDMVVVAMMIALLLVVDPALLAVWHEFEVEMVLGEVAMLAAFTWLLDILALHLHVESGTEQQKKLSQFL